MICVDSLSKTTVIQTEDKGPNPISTLHFSRCSLKDASEFVKLNHYSHTHPGGIDFCFKLEFNGKLAGICMFGYMAGNPKASCIIEGYENPHLYRELMRLVLLDEVPRNSESKFIAWCIRYLKKNTDLIALISFADPKFGHSGIIYKASNWIYCGLQQQDRDRILVNGTEKHPKSCYNMYGTSSIKKLKELGLNIETTPREPKHRYIYCLNKELENKFKDRLFNIKI